MNTAAASPVMTRVVTKPMPVRTPTAFSNRTAIMAANAGTLSELTTAIRCDALSMWFARIPAFAEVTGAGGGGCVAP